MTILPFLAPLKTRRGGSIFPEAVIVMAAVAHFVSFVDLRTWSVLAPTTSKVDLELNVIDTIPTKNGRELVEKWVCELMTNF